MRSDSFWGESKSGCSDLQTLVPDDGDNVGCADGSKAMIGGKITDGGGGIATPIVQAGGDVDARLDWAGCGELRPEVGDGLTADGILLIVDNDNNLCGMEEMLGGGIHGEEKYPDEEHKVNEGP